MSVDCTTEPLVATALRYFVQVSNRSTTSSFSAAQAKQQEEFK